MHLSLCIRLSGNHGVCRTSHPTPPEPLNLSRLEDYADMILQVDPDGPYLLMGYSGGGNLLPRGSSLGSAEQAGCPCGDVRLLEKPRPSRIRQGPSPTIGE